MNKKRLLQIADDVMQAPPPKFDMGSWRFDTDCGTTACAVGNHVMRHPRVPLKLRALEFIPRDYTVLFKGYEGWDAICQYVEVIFDDALYLFDKNEYPSRVRRRQVAARIRNFVKNGGRTN